MDYLDFDLYFSRTSNGYRVRATNSQGAQAAADFELPFTDLEIDNLMLRVGRPRRGARRIESPEIQAAKIFGGKLFDAVFPGEVLGLWRSTLNAAPHGRVRLRLRLMDVPELLDLPWEFLHDNARNQFVALLTRTPVVRFLDLPTPIQPLQVEPPLRVLVVISDASDYEPLDVEREWANIYNATKKLQLQGLMTLTRLEQATLLEMHRTLRQTEYHVLHFIGHGAFDQREQDGVLIFKNDQGRGQRISSQTLGLVLANFDSLRLVILNACEGARTSRTDPFAGVAPGLIQQDKPAVIAMQFEVSDRAAMTFADEFYSALAGGFAVDEALTHARAAILTDGNDLEWGTPVLYMRAKDGVIFGVTDAPSVSLSQPKQLQHFVKPESPNSGVAPQELARWNRQALEAYLLGNWTVAADGLERIVELQPENRDAADKLKESKRQLRLQDRRAMLVSTLALNGWGAAIPILQEILELEPHDADARRQLDEFTERVSVLDSLNDLYQRGLKAFDVKNWEEAKIIFEKISETDPDYLKTREFLAKLPPASRLPAHKTNKVGQEMIFIPAGEFLMGTTDAQVQKLIQEFGKDYEQYLRREQPQHPVYLDAFYISRYPVTNAEYKMFVDATSSKIPDYWKDGEIPAGRAKYPVVNVNWNDAVAFCEWVDGRLPTEAEWEKAASWDEEKRVKRAYPWGDTFAQTKCNSLESRLGDTTPVEKYSPHGDSAYGVGDMAGNAWEWTADWFDENYYKNAPRQNPLNDSPGVRRVLRGGSYIYSARFARCANRNKLLPHDKYARFAFRVVVSS